LVSSSDPDSNLKALKECLLDQVPIPPNQIYGIDESLLSPDSTDLHKIVARDYQERVFGTALSDPESTDTDYLLDIVLLGFGPDGHTASLFPNHELLNEHELLVAGIQDSPKPPPKRITLSMKVFNQLSRNVIFVGAGESKAPILKDIFDRVHLTSEGHGHSKECVVEMKAVEEQQYPCGMIRPRGGGLVYVTDSSGAQDLELIANCCSLL